MKLKKFMAASLCAGLFFTGCGLNSNTSSPSDSGESEHVDYEDLYDDVIALYKESIEKNDPQLVKSRFDTISETEVDETTKPCELPVPLNFWGYEIDNAAYAIDDVTGDDVPELLIGLQPNPDYPSDPNIYSIYGIVDGKVRSLFQAYSDKYLDENEKILGLYDDGIICEVRIGVTEDNKIFYNYAYGAVGAGTKSYRVIFNPLEPEVIEHFDFCLHENCFDYVFREKKEDEVIEKISHRAPSSDYRDKFAEYSENFKEFSWHSF